jgi:hypothetical protein
MSANVPQSPGLLSQLPPSGVIQDRLGELAREERILRQLLRLAVRAELELQGKERASGLGGPRHASS